MLARDYLKQIKELKITIEQLNDEHERVFNQLHNPPGIQYDKDKVQTPIKDNIADLYGFLCENSQKIVEKTKSRYELRSQIIDELYLLHNAVYTDLLYRRYVEDKSFELIAVEMHYAYQSVLNIHQAALKEFEKKILSIK